MAAQPPISQLESQLPELGAPPLAPDEILARFVTAAAASGLDLYPAQEEAILELLEGKHVVLSTPTGSGKSLVAQALHFAALCRGEPSVYTAPIKALVNEKFFQLCDAFGPSRVGLLTGDGAVNADAKVICCTAEVLMGRVLRDPGLRAPAVVMDEFHYYSDRERGVAWQVPLLALERTQFLLMSATLGDTRAIEKALQGATGREAVAVASATRPVPLEFEWRETPLHESLQDLVARGRAPVYLVNFSQRAAAERAQDLMSADFSSKEEKEALKAATAGLRFETPYGKEFLKFLRHGIGLHHAGLLPRYRLLVEKLAQQGLLRVISGTDTLGVGVNIPIRTVVFSQLFKFDGEKLGQLSVREFRQIAGRAGRKGFDERGYVVAQAPEHVIENRKLEAKAAQGKKVQKKKPPEKGYVHYDKATFDRLREGAPEPLESRFQVTHGMILLLLQAEQETSARDAPGPQGYGRLVGLICKSHGHEGNRRLHLRSAAASLRTLRRAGVVELVRGNEWRRPYLKVSARLQDDFSLDHTLALWLYDTLPRLDRSAETYARDVLTLVESILENPQAVLWAQLDRAKGEAVAEMKARGMDYADRMVELEKVEYPKPLREFVYETFNAFAEAHPWVGAENIRPKSVAREMFETYASFNEYVRDYSLQRSEGQLLRYLTDAYKTLLKSVPEEARNDELEEILEHLRQVVRGVDSSLLDEWERRMDPAAPPAVRAGAAGADLAPERPQDELQLLLRDERRRVARVRSELHRLLAALARKDWEEAQRAVFVREGAEPWTPARLERALAPYFAAHAQVDLTPRARRPDRTALVAEGPKAWRAQQRFGPPPRPLGAHEALAADPSAAAQAEALREADEADWGLECRVDLGQPRPLDAPLIELVGLTAP
jgi:superfamily II RNA helicase